MFHVSALRIFILHNETKKHIDILSPQKPIKILAVILHGFN
jgi:hypothetical protein